VSAHVRVVWVRLDRYHDGLLDLLDSAELDRLSAYRGEADRRRFVLGAALLHHQLGRATGTDPRRCLVDRTCPGCGRAHGAPRPLTPGWWSSVSHSGDTVTVAVTRAGAVGVDVEEERMVDDATMAMALRPRELAWVRADPPRRAERFTLMWTGKEAVLKALGVGIPGLEEVELDAEDEFRVIRLPTQANGPVYLRHYRTAVGPLALAVVASRRPAVEVMEIPTVEVLGN
jgi:4'-phosphopantetheinyl transferase